MLHVFTPMLIFMQQSTPRGGGGLCHPFFVGVVPFFVRVVPVVPVVPFFVRVVPVVPMYSWVLFSIHQMDECTLLTPIVAALSNY